tara:strand:- start:2982 stop:3749 length:768 start_codon:yes stop_codon:yes gene_type:complete
MATRKIQDTSPPTTTPPGSSGTGSAIENLDAAAANQPATAADEVIYSPGQRLIVVNGKWQVYKGPGLVDAKGRIVTTSTYNLDSEPGRLWASFNPRERAAKMEQLVSAGFLSTAGLDDYNSQLNGIAQWLQASNYLGLEKENTLSTLIAGGPQISRGGGSSPNYVVSNPEELKVIAKKVSQETLGRELNDEDINRFVKAYQAQELQAQQGSGVVTRMAGSDVAAQEFAKKSAPTEAAAYEYLGYVNKFVDAIGSL